MLGSNGTKVRDINTRLFHKIITLKTINIVKEQEIEEESQIY